MKIQINPITASLIKIYDEVARQQIKTLCFTSTTAKEGTTTMACALAKAVAASGHKVLYCDFCDDDHSLSRQFNKTFTPTKGSDLKQFQHNSYLIESLGFHLLPPPLSKPELFEKTLLSSLLEELKKEYDLIVIDTDSFNSHTELGTSTPKLCKLADATVLVVLSGGVTDEEVKQVVDKMKLQDIKILGFMMNDINHSKLLDELIEATHSLDEHAPKLSQHLRDWFNKSSLLKIEI